MFDAGSPLDLDLSALQLPAFWDNTAQDLSDETCLLLAVSGGPDSLSMLLGLAALAAREQLAPRLIVATIDHGLREEAAEEARLVEAVAKALGLPCWVSRVTEPPKNGNTQAWAREVRYQKLIAIAEAEAASIVTAHTLEDQAETFLMRSARGTGSAGLAAMRPVTVRGQTRVLRPFLSVPAGDLRAILTDLPIQAVSDPSNHDPAYTRVRFRRWLAASPKGDGGKSLATGFADSAAILAEESDALMHYAHTIADAFEGLASGYAVGSIDLSTPRPVLIRALSLIVAAVNRANAPSDPPTLSKLGEIIGSLSQSTNGRTVVSGAELDWQMDPADPGRISLRAYAEAGRVGFPTLQVGAEKSGVWDGRFSVFNGSHEAVEIAAWSGRRRDLPDRKRFGQIALSLPAAYARNRLDEPEVIAVPRGAESVFGVARHPDIRIERLA